MAEVVLDYYNSEEGSTSSSWKMILIGVSLLALLGGIGSVMTYCPYPLLLLSTASSMELSISDESSSDPSDDSDEN